MSFVPIKEAFSKFMKKLTLFREYWHHCSAILTFEPWPLGRVNHLGNYLLDRIVNNFENLPYLYAGIAQLLKVSAQFNTCNLTIRSLNFMALQTRNCLKTKSSLSEKNTAENEVWAILYLARARSVFTCGFTWDIHKYTPLPELSQRKKS